VLPEESGLFDSVSAKSRSASPRATESLHGVMVPLGGLDEYPGGGVSGCGGSVTELDLLCEPRLRTLLIDWRSEGSMGRRFDTTVDSTLYSMLGRKLFISESVRDAESKVLAKSSASSTYSMMPAYLSSVAPVTCRCAPESSPTVDRNRKRIKNVSFD
jgi:hypothetical protein